MSNILNPNVYLNYLSPAVASEYEVSRDLSLATLGALLWDILSSIPDDLKIIKTTKFSPVIFAYLSSRTSALAVVLLSVLMKTGPIQNCGLVELILCIFWVIASGSSSYLFLKRVHAVFFEERLVRHAFTFLWIAGVGASMTMLPWPMDDYYQIASTKHCINRKVRGYVFVAFIVTLLFDSLVFFAITYKILMFHRLKKPMTWKDLCYRKALPRLSQAILQGGQQYYMITTTVNIKRTIIVLLPNVSPVLQLSLLAPAVALTSAMACRVFRNFNLEASQRPEDGILTTIRFADRERINVHLPKNTDILPNEDGFEQR